MTATMRVEKLRRDHPLEGFDCGEASLDRFLVRHALQNQQMGASQTYLALSDGQTLGYYTLVFGEVAYADAPERLQKGAARHPVPLMLLARLAVAENAKGRGLGAALLKDAMLRTLAAAEIAGLRALAVHAKDETARRFYAHFDFVPSPSDPLHLLFLLKDIRALLGR
jgi:GNAT superfamily N-acetyltransferase